ncbi:uncharacterized protein LOC123563543 [Mercenaria mercenaria]|uniref:uncharacterized protein LOC123563543 n=1 Tax=Mercenaria mercenaria TaxID=6596 RepID=UPI00234ED165|nr:uncharacterized protein LOC123563543 [Mercenaria mercenaria]XP_045212327.2 uncharacterized protein LOC123563543 [Mercenaria mercenaria]
MQNSNRYTLSFQNIKIISASLQQPFVHLTTKVVICETHCSKQSCDGVKPHCSGLHICKYYLLSGNCRFGRRCSFGHDLNTDHNRKLLEESHLNNITVNDLNFLLKQVNNRTTLTSPGICKFYNIENDKCRHSEHGTVCPLLHICRHYVNGDCMYGKKCRRSHNILDDASVLILQKHGIDTRRRPAEILKELRSLDVQNRAKDGLEADIKERSARPTQEKNGLQSEQNIYQETILSSDEGANSSDDALSVKKEEIVDEENPYQEVYTPQLHVTVLSDHVPFRYMSAITASEKRAKGKRDKLKNADIGSLVEVHVENYSGNITIVGFCADCDGKVHPYNLYGENCKDGVYNYKCKTESGSPIKLFGVSIITPKVKEYQDSLNTTVAFLGKCGVSEMKLCETIEDKHSIYLKFIVFLEECGKSISGISPVIRSRKNQAGKEDGHAENCKMAGQKRAFECPDGENAKRRKESNTVTLPVRKVFERCYSRQSPHTWGNFIDTSGYQESALTWKAQGEALRSVCMICYPGGTATGFRVGSQKNYIMTAAHVLEHIRQPGHRRVGRSKLSPLNNSEVFVVFDYLKEGEIPMSNKFHFKADIHFENAETDTVILEILENGHGTPIPPPLTYFRAPDFTKEFFFIGHSEGKPLGINKVNKIVDMNSKESRIDRKNVRQWSLTHTKCVVYPKGREYEHEPFQTLTNKHRFLFHCKFTKGASGSPGVVCLNDGRKVVVTMLLRGYPEWYYDPNMEEFKANWSKDGLCVEQGVNLESVYTFLFRDNKGLCMDIFGSETD